jgi:serine/threonine-protein kinase
MVTGAPPHASSADPIARKLAEPVQSPRMFRPEIPAQLEALIMAALDRDPAARPASMAAFEEILVSVSRAREAEPAADEAERATPPVSPDRRRARREAAFRAIGELLTTEEPRTDVELVPPILAPPEPPAPSVPDVHERPTPLQAPTAEAVAATAESSFEVPTAKDAFAWTPPAPGASPSSPTVGGAMLERYGDASPGKSKAIVAVVVALALAGTAAFLLLR